MQLLAAVVTHETELYIGIHIGICAFCPFCVTRSVHTSICTTLYSVYFSILRRPMYYFYLG